MRSFLLTAAGAVLAAATVLAGPGHAKSGQSGQTCGFEADIVALAERALGERHTLTGFHPGRYGTEAVYFWLHYAAPAPDEGLAKFAEVRAGAARAPRDLDALEMAYAIARLGAERGLGHFGAAPLDAFAELDHSAVRALVLSDGGATFFRLLQQVRADPARNETFRGRWPAAINLVLELLDLPDDDKLAIAELAEQAGERVFAASLLSSRADLGPYRAILGRYPDDKTLHDIAGPRWVTNYGLPTLHNAAPIEDLSALDAERRALHEQLFNVLRAAYRNPVVDFLMIGVNQTGRSAEFDLVARDYLALVDAGEISPAQDAEIAWLHIYRAMIRHVGAEITLATLGSFDLPTTARHFSGRAQDLFDWVVAKDATRAYVRGEAALPPARPDILSPGFDWVRWIAVAAAVRQGGEVAGEDFEIRAAVEMHLLRDEFDQAVALAGLLAPEGRQEVYRDLLRRLDRLCRGVGVFPGQSILFGGELVHRF